MGRKLDLINERQDTWDREEKQTQNGSRQKEKSRPPRKEITKEERQALNRQVMDFMQSANAPLGGTGAAYAREAQKQGRLTEEAENTLKAVQKEQEKAKEKREAWKEDRQEKDTRNVKSYLERVSPQNTGASYGAMNQGKETESVLAQHKAEREQANKRAEAKAAEEYAAEQARRQEEENLLRADMEELNSWPEQDVAALKTYIIERGREADPTSGYSFGTARTNAAELFNKYGAKKIKEMAESYGRWENERNAQEITAAGEAAAESGGIVDKLGTFGANVASVGANIAGAVTGTAGYLNEMANRTGRYATLDANSEGNAFTTWASAVRQKTAQNIQQGATGNVGATIYQGAMSAADSLTRALIAGPAGAATLAASDSFARNVSEASRQGASPVQAVTLGVANAGIEYLTEKIPLDNLFKAAKSGAKGAKEFIKGILVQGGIEASTEELSLLGNIAAEAAILGEKDSNRQRIGELVANGATYEQAKEQVDRELWAEAANTFAVSFTAGALGAGASQMIGNLAGAEAETGKPQEQPVQQPQAEKTPQQRLMETMAPIAQNAPQAAQTEQQVKAADAARAMLTGIVPGGAANTEVAANQVNMPAAIQQQTEQTGQSVTPQMEYDLGIKGTGAAERGFTPKQALINQYGNIPEGENPVRADQLPQSITGEDRVSRTARTALEAKVTPDEFVPLIENKTVNQGFSYIPITNDATVQKATQEIAAEGWKISYANWKAKVRGGETSADITATGAILYNHAVNSGDFDEAMDILVDYQLAVRNSAQALQAARILKTLTPSDRLWMIRRSIDRMVEDMHLKRKITINEKLAREYQTASDERADEILDEIAADVARQIKPTFMEMFTAIRYLNMLGNLKTQVRNIAGNVGASITYSMKNQVKATVEDILSVVTNGSYQRTTAHITDMETRKAAKADFENVRNWALEGGKFNDQGSETDDFISRVNDKRKILIPGLEQYRQATNWAMNNDYFGDAAFGRAAYAKALAGYLNARGIHTGDFDSIDPAIMERAREYAVRQAQESTFRDNNRVSNFVAGAMRGKNTPAWIKVIGEGIMPFRKTPANVLVRATEFSPLGLINSAALSVRKAAGDTQVTGDAIVESWAKTLTGTGLLAIGYALANMGYLVGGPDPDEDKAEFDALNGQQNYALMLPNGKNITIDFLSPMAMPMFMGAQLERILGAETDVTWSDLEKMFTSLADPMIKMSMLQGLSDTLENVQYAESNLGQFVINSIVSYLTQGLTNTLFGQIERSTESVRTTTYIDKDSNTPQWLQRELGKASQKTPFWDYQQTPYINAYGQEEEQRTDAMGWLYNLISPGYIDQKEVDALAAEMYRLNETGAYDGNVFITSPATSLSYTDKNGEKHKNYQMNMKEADTMKRATGQTATEILNEAIESPVYGAMTDAQKAKVFEYVYDYAREKGRTAAIEGYEESSAWMKGIDGRELKTILDKVTTAAINDAVGKYDAKSLLDAYNAYNAMDDAQKYNFRKNAEGRTKDYMAAKAAGIGENTFLEAYKKYKEIDATDEKQSQKAKSWALWLDQQQQMGKISQKQRDALKEEMTYSQMLTVETKKYDGMVESGIDPQTAYDIGKLLEGIKPQKGYTDVRPVQQVQAIAGIENLNDEDMAAAMKLYLSDSQDENLEDMMGLGFTPAQYAAAWAIYTEEKDAGGKGTKYRIISRLGEEFGTRYAYEIYGIFG